jgi:AcrR family transcriptional regulator
MDTAPDAPAKDAPTKGNVKVTREDWLKLAGEVLIERGVSQVKVLTLANSLGVSRSSFYWYFRSRKDLLDQLLEGWEGQNTRAVIDHAARPAGNICRAVMHLFECFIDPNQFDPRLDFAVREWARRAFTRARIIYFMQIGYYALVENEPFETRFTLLQNYLVAYTSEEPDPAEMWEFLEVARKLLQP